MHATATTRQIRNDTLRAMGIRPTESYQFRLEPGDTVRLHIVVEEPFVNDLYEAEVVQYDDHGWYAEAIVRKLGTDCCRSIRLYQDGPEPWGVVECRIVKASESGRRQPYDAFAEFPPGMLAEHPQPVRCSGCGALLQRTVRGVACLACAVRAMKETA